MKAMITGFAAIIVISVIAWYGLHQLGFSSQDVNSSGSVRLD